MSDKQYLGDSVYVETDYDRGMFCLTTDNGFGPSNTIWLEPQTFTALVQYGQSKLHPAAKAETAQENGDADVDG